MADRFSLLVVLIVVVLLVVGTLLLMSIRRSERDRKLFYILLLGCEFAWFFVLDWLFTLVGMPRIWQDVVEGVLFALVIATLVLLFRHRHDPDPVGL